MLAKDLNLDPYIKARHCRSLKEQLDQMGPPRSVKAIGRKHSNISAVLQRFGEPWIRWYKPLAHYQTGLVDAVARWLHNNPGWGSDFHDSIDEDIAIEIEKPPLPIDELPQEEQETLRKTDRISNKYDIARRQARNHALGRAGEKYVLACERDKLKQQGRDDLAEEVCRLSETDDGAGYDVESFTKSGERRRIEVKTTGGWERTPFYITRNELSVSKKFQTEWLILRVWNFYRAPRAFELRPPLDRRVLLTPANYLASFES